MIGLSYSCGKESGDRAAIGDTIKGYISSYNASNFEECITYFTDYGDKEDAISELTFFRSLSGELGYRKVKDIVISGQTATVSVVFTIGGEEGTDMMQLRKVDGKWKIIWEQETISEDAAAMRDTVVGYLAAYNAGDFAGCLPYLTGFGDAQEAKDSLSLIKEHIETITFTEMGMVGIAGTGDVAEGFVTYSFWSSEVYKYTYFRKEAGVWKIEWGQGFTMDTAKRLIPVTVEIPTDLSGVLEAKCVGFERDDGVWAWAWCAWQVRNTGAQTLRFEYTIGLYDKDGSSIEGGMTYLGDIQPGKAGGCLNLFGPHPLDTISHIEVILECTD